jgi:hypothetical protein
MQTDMTTPLAQAGWVHGSAAEYACGIMQFTDAEYFPIDHSGMVTESGAQLQGTMVPTGTMGQTPPFHRVFPHCQQAFSPEFTGEFC